MRCSSNCLHALAVCRCKNVHSVYCRERVGHSTPSVPSESNPAASAQPQLHICISGSSLELSEPPLVPAAELVPFDSDDTDDEDSPSPSSTLQSQASHSTISSGFGSESRESYLLAHAWSYWWCFVFICSSQMMKQPFQRTWPPRPPALRRNRSFPSRAHSGLLGSVRTVPWTAEPCGGPVEAPSPVPVWRTCWASTPRRIRAPSGSGPRTAGGSLHDRINHFCNVMQKIERDMSFQSVCRQNHRL